MVLDPKLITALTKMQDGLFGAARNIREQGSETLPMAIFVIADHDAETLSFNVEIMSLVDVDKPQWRSAILTGIAELRAVAVIHHSETWLVIGDAITVAVAASLGSLQDYAGRKEVLRSSMEVVDGTQRDLVAEIDSSGKLGPTEVQTAFIAQSGRLTGFYAALKPASPKPAVDN